MRKTTLLSILTLLALPASMQAQGPFGGGFEGDGPPPWMERRHERIAEFLELSEEQAVQWRALHEERTEAMRSRFEQVRSMLEAETPDEAAVGRAVIAAHREMEALSALGDELHAELAELLTPDQLEKLETVRQAREELGPRRGGRRGGPFGRHGARHGRFGGTAEDGA